MVTQNPEVRKLLLQIAADKRFRKNRTPESRGFLQLARKFAYDFDERAREKGVETRCVVLHGSTKRGAASNGSDIDLNFFIKLPQHEAGNYPIFEKKMQETMDILYGLAEKHKAVQKVETKIGGTFYPENILEEELFSKPTHIFTFLSGAPLVGRNEYKSIRNEIITRLEKDPVLRSALYRSLEEAKKHQEQKRAFHRRHG
jgi:predicted nucleotidyltransferase